MKKVIGNQWDSSKGSYYLRRPNSDGRESYAFRYEHNGIIFRGVVREQSPNARYAYRGEITAISPLTGEPVKDSKGNVVSRSFWSNETDLDKMLDYIAKAVNKLYANNAVALSRAVERNAVFRPETTTPSVAAEHFAARYEESHSTKKKESRKEKRYPRDAVVIKEYYAQLPQKPMCEIAAVEIRRLLPAWKLSQKEYSLLRDFWDWCIKSRYCTGTNPFPEPRQRTKSPEDKAKAAETPEILDESDVEKIFDVLMEDVNQTGKACAMALNLFGGLDNSRILELAWGDIVFDDGEPDKVIVKLRDDKRSGSTHKLDRPIFPMGARVLRTRYQCLLRSGVSESTLREQKVAGCADNASRSSGKITQYVTKCLKGIGLARAYYSKKEPDKILQQDNLLANTYKHMVHYTCGLGAAEPGSAHYLCGEDLTGNVTDDNYTSFSSQEGLERLYAYMHRLCVPETLPQDIPPQTAEDGDGVTTTYLPKTSRERVTVIATVLLQPGQTLTIEAAHGGTGTIETDEEPRTGRRHPHKRAGKEE